MSNSSPLHAFVFIANALQDGSQQVATGDKSFYDGGMEARVAKLEASMEHVQRDLFEIKTDIREIRANARSDFRLIFGALIAVALGLAGLMAK